MCNRFWMMHPIANKYEIHRASVSAIVKLAVDKRIPRPNADEHHQQHAHGKYSYASHYSGETTVHTPNDPDHRPRAKDARLETTAFSRGSVDPAGSAAWSLSLSSLSWGGGCRCGLCAGRRGKWRGDNVVLDVDPSRASLPWRGEVAGQPAKQTDGDCCEQHDLRCSRCFHAIGIV